ETGDLWRREIDGALQRAGLALLLVSPHFLASRFIKEVELPALAERRVRLFPVLVHPCGWEVVPLLNEGQWAEKPPKPVGSSRGDNLLSRINDLCKKIDALMEQRVERAPLAVVQAPLEVETLAPASKPGHLDGVPPRPSAYVTRAEDLERLKRPLLSTEVS